MTNIVDMEVAYINTENPGFDKFRSGVYKLMAAHHANNEQQARSKVSLPPTRPHSLVDAQGSERVRAPAVQGSSSARETRCNGQDGGGVHVRLLWLGS